MESAIDIVDKIRELNSDDFYTLHTLAAADLVNEFAAAIRKECADRAVECGEKAGMNKLQLASLRAAIEGGHHA